MDKRERRTFTEMFKQEAVLLTEASSRYRKAAAFVQLVSAGLTVKFRLDFTLNQSMHGCVGLERSSAAWRQAPGLRW